MGNNMKCKDCSHWDVYSCCDAVSMDDPDYPHNNNELFGIRVNVLDDSGLDVYLRTSPNFGCLNFNAKV